MTAEHARLEEARTGHAAWRKWGPYLSERQWGTVREDYSPNGDAWSYFNHDQSRSRAYRWGEDGLAGISDDRQYFCFGLALWNGVDAILKERLFGLTNSEGNHGEDVKEYYYYLDSTPTHSYLKHLYKYPQGAFPYDQLVAGNRERTRLDPEYELLDTGIFAEQRYFDVVTELAKAGPDEIYLRITVHNRGPDPATLHLLPSIWFRNDWTWEGHPKPSLRAEESTGPMTRARASHPIIGDVGIAFEGAVPLLFTDNETNHERLYGTPNPVPFVKDAFHRYVVQGVSDTINPAQTGTKMAAHYVLTIPAGGEAVVRLAWGGKSAPDLADCDACLAARQTEANAYYAEVLPAALTDDQKRVARQALAGMLWSKQYFYYDLDRWLEERGAGLFQTAPGPIPPRNDQWHHMENADVISMPDKWEYPWYAAWDLAFHVLALSMVDSDFAQEQLSLMLSSRYLHPNGQIPAYEWNFSDVNPPVHAWATIFLYKIELSKGRGDLPWLRRSFDRLLMNFTWWVNRKDRTGRNVFEGGFLGLDNIGVFDRSKPLPTGGYLEQADGTAWMALFSQNMLEMAIELSRVDEDYSEMAMKFVQHFLWIASAMSRVYENDGGMWDEADGFFYDVLRHPDGQAVRLKVRSMVGLLPLAAVTVFASDRFEHIGEDVMNRFRRFLTARPELIANIHDLVVPGSTGRHMLAVVNEDRLRRILAYMLDENEFLSPYGLRSLSKFHDQNPYVYRLGDEEYRVAYLPGESDSWMFGGNSNWRGPIWMPVNVLMLRALLHYHAYFGDQFTVECPTGSGVQMNLEQVALEIARRLGRLFLTNEQGQRPTFGSNPIFQTDPHWKDHVLFYEYFHAETGEGLGASHQTGWTGIIARIMDLAAQLTKPQ